MRGHFDRYGMCPHGCGWNVYLPPINNPRSLHYNGDCLKHPCPNCGKSNPRRVLNCGHCGQRLKPNRKENRTMSIYGPVTDRKFNEELEKLINDDNTQKQFEELEREGRERFEFIWRRLNLIPVEALRELVKVLALGASKHGAEGWRDKYAEDAQSVKQRYYAHALEHIARWNPALGERDEKESGMNHLAHAAADLLILLAIDEIERKKQ